MSQIILKGLKMYFKPRIFISSTLDLKGIRQKVRYLLESVGAEVMLYEENLTPSIQPATYRQDVLDADFIIFIFDSRYGAKTEQGISGTNEEWLIVKNTSIPKHVYVYSANNDQERELKEFISTELSQTGISYYYYKDHRDLIKHIKSTVFSVAKEIAVSKLETLNIDNKLIKMVKTKSDYATSLQFIKQIEDVINLSKVGMCDLIESTALLSVIEPWDLELKFDRWVFIDEKLNDEFAVMLTAFEAFLNIHKTYYTSYRIRTIKLPASGIEITFDELKAKSNDHYSEIEDALKSFLQKYRGFKELAQELRSSTDILT